MQVLLNLVTQVAPSRSTILISGESGTGKELIAKAIHSASTRAEQSLCARKYGIDPRGSPGVPAFRPCEGRLHQRRCFQKGLFEIADQGTIFFDEIATISPETQAKLLRVNSGSANSCVSAAPSNSRLTCAIVAASNVDLLTLVREGRLPRRFVSPPET